MQAREEVLKAIREKPQVPVLILGGGINGIGLFRELALQGVDCLLVDKGDFAAGATSKSSRMIHGGLRYLENREFKLVAESLTERDRLLENAAHYVSPLRTTIPLFSWLGGIITCPLVFLGFNVKPGGRGAVVVKFGLCFYDFVTRKSKKTPRHFLLSKSQSLREVPGLHPDIVATATYWDARITQAERLCVELLRDAGAANPNCRALNYTRLVKADGAKLTLKDDISGAEFVVEPRVVVNATGGWVDITNATLGLKTRMIGGTKGSHLVVDCKELYDALGDRMVYYEHQDGRICIVFRFMDKVLMGSTDIRVDDPDKAVCDEAEMDYMLATLRRVFPKLTIGREHIRYVFCGVRPLPAAGTDVTGKISRGHSIELVEPDGARPFPLYCLIGGKWTTFRAFAEQTADKVLARLGLPRKRSSETTAIGGGRAFPHGETQAKQWIERVARESKLTAERVATLLQRYGTDAEAFAKALGGKSETPLKSLPGYTVEEIERLAATESVVHLTDLLCRRSTIAIQGHASRAAIEEVAAIVAKTLGWDDAKRQEQVNLAAAEVAVPGTRA
jgi:glycerol-3-phosphate dehydrogenase